jgi:glycosyltransferase involved in cell wall biosynthesis
MTHASTSRRPIKVMHVIGGLGHGGIETWLMNIMRLIDRHDVQFDFAINPPGSGPYVDEVRALGGEVFLTVPANRKPWLFQRQFAQLLRQHGPYDVVHSHVHFMSGIVLRVAAACGVPIRIAHSHADLRREQAMEWMPRRLFTQSMRAWVYRYATHGLAISDFAAQSLFGDRWQSDPRWRVLLYGFDFSRFTKLPDRASLRRKLGLPERQIVVGQVGRLVDQKNYFFSLDVISELLRSNVDVHFLVVGSGSNEAKIRERLRCLGLTECVTLAGDQHDVTPFYGTMDCMILPSLHEGLGIVALEAQAVGVPVIASEFVPREANVIPALMFYAPLTKGPRHWAQIIQEVLKYPMRNAAECSAEMSRSVFSASRCLNDLYNIYWEGGRQSRGTDERMPLASEVV